MFTINKQERPVKLKKIAQVISLLCIAVPAFAQTPPPAPAAPATPAKPAVAPAPKAEKIEVTGSSIKRVQDEGATPLQIITKEDIDRAGIVTAEELVSLLSANGTGADNMSSNVAFSVNANENRNSNSVASANLRGLGASSTLVLLNGRRVSTHGARGNAVDLNAIPLAAVERVEVLKDGASAIYGTDAIGGVINFIMRKDFKGVDIRATSNVTQDGGGGFTRGSIVGGFGDLAKDGFNVVASFTVDRQEKLRGAQRSFVNGNQPDRGLTPDTGGGPFATQNSALNTGMGVNPPGSPIIGSYTLPVPSISLNRANLLSFQNRCDIIGDQFQYRADVLGPAFYNAARGCSYDYGKQRVLIQPVDRQNLVARGTWAFAENHSAIVELVGSRTEATNQFEELQINTSIAAGSAYPVGGPFYQSLLPFIPTFRNDRPIAYRWRCIACGPRESTNVSTAYRAMVALEGTLGKFDYKVGYSQAGNSAGSTLTGGYFRTLELNAALGSGLINPWLLPGQSQTPAALALLDSARANGTSLFGGEAGLTQFDGTISGEVFNLPAGVVAAAVGFDVRKESFKFRNDSTSVAILGAPFDTAINKATRDIKATYAEISIPILKSLEFTAAVRNDRYSDFGNTTNPKYSIRFNPFKWILFRGSYNEGFRAPSFFQLYSIGGASPLAQNINDPILCATFVATNPACGIRVDQISGGNPFLKPEISKQNTIGMVLSPTDWLTLSVDTYKVERTQRIFLLQVTGANGVLANFQTFPDSFIRDAAGNLTAIRAGYVNADGDILKAVDIGIAANWKALGGTWKASIEGTRMQSYKSRIFKNRDYVEAVGGAWDASTQYLKWKHTARASYTKGSWSTTVSQNYSSGYKDFVPDGVAFAPNFNPNVKAYTVYNASVSYSGVKDLTLIGGIQNLLNTDPPFTAANVDFAPGTAWDARVANPRGRTFTLTAAYRFR
jgi:iron complex outermembrane recepter protein